MKTVIDLKEWKQQKIDILDKKKDPTIIDDYFKSIRAMTEIYKSSHTFQETIGLLEGIYYYTKFSISYNDNEIEKYPIEKGGHDNDREG